jgi:hypothetical protein
MLSNYQVETDVKADPTSSFKKVRLLLTFLNITIQKDVMQEIEGNI